MTAADKQAQEQRSVGLQPRQRGKAAATIAARLTLDRVSRRYGSVLALDEVSLDVPPGQILCLLGPSGCGKSTLLRIVAGVERPSGGRVLMNGQEIAGPNRFVPPERRGIGLMFQDFALFPHLTILDNVAFGLVSLGRQAARQEARLALERVGLARYAQRYPHVLSGGEQQRVALARAIAPRPSVLLMDEPFSGLDIRLREVMREETLAILKETRATCIIVTHAPEEAMRLGNVIALMRAGRIVQSGTAEALYRAPADIDAARMFSDLNELLCPVADRAIDTPFGRVAAGSLPEGAMAVVCVRQRDVHLVAPGQGRSGRVLARRFLGDLALVEIGVEGLEHTLTARMREPDAAQPGDEVGVVVDPQRMLVFPAPEEGDAGR